jgi:hypothetical protein
MSLVLSLTQSLRTQYPNNLDKNERRLSRYGAWDFARKDSTVPGTILTPDIDSKIKMSFGNTVVVPVIDSEVVAIGNTRSCVVADDENTSKLITLSFVSYAFGFTMYPAQHYNNDVKYQADYDTKLLKYLLQLASVLDSQVITTVDAVKNQFWTGIDPDFYANVGNALQVPQAGKEDFFNQASSVLERMDFYGNPVVLHNTYAKPNMNRLLNQGPNNAINEQFQFDPYTFFGTNRIPNGAGIQSAGYLIQEGSMAVENRNDPDAIMKSVGPGMEWNEVDMPIVNLKMGSFYKTECNDASALHAVSAGLKNTLRESFQFSTDVCFMTVYNSAIGARYNPFVNFQILTT